MLHFLRSNEGEGERKVAWQRESVRSGFRTLTLNLTLGGNPHLDPPIEGVHHAVLKPGVRVRVRWEGPRWEGGRPVSVCFNHLYEVPLRRGQGEGEGEVW